MNLTYFHTIPSILKPYSFISLIYTYLLDFHTIPSILKPGEQGHHIHDTLKFPYDSVYFKAHFNNRDNRKIISIFPYDSVYFKAQVPFNPLNPLFIISIRFRLF